MIKPRPVAVGAFLLAAFALVVAGILFFTAGTLTAKHLRTVSFFPGTVAGLQVGSTVTFLGVPVGQVTSLGYTPTGGKAPRSFAIDPSGRWLIAANQQTDSLVSFAIDQSTGALTPTGATSALPRPVCVLFVPPSR